MGVGEGCEGRVTKGYKKILLGDAYVHCLDFADSFLEVCIYVCVHTHVCVYVKTSSCAR